MGMSSKDNITRVFTLINNNQLENCFTELVSSIAYLSLGQIIAIDCKTIREEKYKGKK